jgi:hypothetical protein
MLCKNRVSLTRRRENGMTRAALVKLETQAATYRPRFTVAKLAAPGRQSDAEKIPWLQPGSRPFSKSLAKTGKPASLRPVALHSRIHANSKDLI